MRICPTCRAAYPARGRATCAKDGTRLIEPDELERALKDPLLGRTIGGRFRVLARIGTGGMGTVYSAEQAGLDRPVALKVLKKELVSDRDTVARFHREAKAMSRLVHPNTVRVFDFGEDAEGHLYLAMELLEGELLTSWIERDEAPPVREAVEVVRDILRSLGEAHSKGIIHRDLKPDNIFLARVDGHARPVVKVLDFGIAKVFRDDRKIDQLETQAGTVFGTPRYMSPEQAQGRTLDHRSDLYSVGVLLYQLLACRPPFIDDDAVVVMAKHIRETPPPLAEVAPDRPVPRSLERAMMRAMAKEASKRFDDADAFESRLRACLADVDIEAARGRRAKLLARLGALPRLPVAIGGGIVTVALAIGVAIAVGGPPDEVARARVEPVPPAESAPPAEDASSELPAVAAPVSVVLASIPAGAEIWRGEDRVGTTPRSFELGHDETLELTLRAEGHDAADVRLSAEAAPLQQVSLRPSEPQEPTVRVRPSRHEESPGPAPEPPPERDPYSRFD